MDPMIIKSATEAANFAAVQSDRWLFVATLIICLLAIGMVAKWGMARIEALQTRIDVNQKEFTDFLQSRNTALVGAVEKNTQVIEKCTGAVERAEKLMDRVVQALPSTRH